MKPMDRFDLEQAIMQADMSSDLDAAFNGIAMAHQWVKIRLTTC